MAKIRRATEESLRKINRYFSESFRISKVREIEQNLTTVLEVSRGYEVSTTAVYKWLYRYSGLRKKGIKQVIELMSDTKKIEALKRKIAELEQTVGQKQILLEFQEKMLELASKEVGFDLKKSMVSVHRLLLAKQAKVKHVAKQTI